MRCPISNVECKCFPFIRYIRFTPSSGWWIGNPLHRPFHVNGHSIKIEPNPKFNDDFLGSLNIFTGYETNRKTNGPQHIIIRISQAGNVRQIFCRFIGLDQTFSLSNLAAGSMKITFKWEWKHITHFYMHVYVQSTVSKGSHPLCAKVMQLVTIWRREEREKNDKILSNTKLKSVNMSNNWNGTHCTSDWMEQRFDSRILLLFFFPFLWGLNMTLNIEHHA